jgi:hypothetical protein
MVTIQAFDFSRFASLFKPTNDVIPAVKTVADKFKTRNGRQPPNQQQPGGEGQGADGM